MSIDEFWNIVERVHIASGGDMNRKCDLLEFELRRLPTAKVRAFGECLGDFFFRAYTWDLWGAAYLITNGWCGDDSFMDFRDTLISMGRKVYEDALANPDSLAVVSFSNPKFEGYQYVPTKVYQDLMKQSGVTEQDLFEEDERVRASAPRHPRRPGGVQFHEWAMEGRYPKLAAKYGHKDADFKREQDRAARIIQD